MQHLLLLHGAVGACQQLQPLRDLLSENYHIHCINFNGHGGAKSDNTFTIEGFAKDVLAYLRQNNIFSAAVFGYSMGGYVAMYLAKNNPGTIDRLVTLATKFHWDKAIANREIKMLDAGTIREKVPAFAKQLAQLHGAGEWEILLDKTKALMLALGDRNVLTAEDYRQISIPCLLLLGDKDRMVTEEETVAVQQALPIGAYRQLAHTSHPLEQADVKMLAGIIKEFIR